MTPDERDARLTAYALNDPSLSIHDRSTIEKMLHTDPEAARLVRETQQVAQQLTQSLATELATEPVGPPMTIPRPRTRTLFSAPVVLVGLAASVALFVGLGYLSSVMLRDQDEVVSLTPAIGTLEPDLTTQSHKEKSHPAPDSEAHSLPTVASGDATRSLESPLRPVDMTSKQLKSGPVADSGARDQLQSVLLPPSPGQPAIAVPNDPVHFPDYADQQKFKETYELGQKQADPTTEEQRSRDRYQRLIENAFIKVEGQAALSTFGVDVDTASYAIVRKYLTMGQLPPTNAVRLEELVNYFPYQDKAPEGDNPFAVTVELAECPWQPKHRLARIGLKAKPIATDKRPPSNLVFLIDVSGSMNEPNKLPLVKESLKMLVRQLGENDRVAMVVYAGSSGLVLDSTSATKKEQILSALDRLEAGGSTNGSGGIHQAYAVATANFIQNGTNRVILCTDGDWNVGTTGTADLVKLIEEKRKTGVFLSVFGFGMGNLRDEMMVQLAGKGNGNYGYIDTLKEANKALAEQLSGTLVTVAKDVKIQVEFNPGVIQSYRLLGYEKRALAAKDFHDDTKDAGEMGAGHVVTALYELVPVGTPAPVVGTVDNLRYQPNANPKPDVKPEVVPGAKTKESFVVKMRHKKPDSDVSTLRELPVTDPGKGYAEASEDFRFSAAVASFALLLKESPYKGQASYALTQELAAAAMKHDPSGYRAEFLELIRLAKTLSGKP